MSDNNDEMNGIRSELKLIRHTIDEINLAVTGDTDLGIPGLAKRMANAEKADEEMRAWRHKINLKVATTAGIVSGVTFGGLEGVKDILHALLHHVP